MRAFSRSRTPDAEYDEATNARVIARREQRLQVERIRAGREQERAQSSIPKKKKKKKPLFQVSPDLDGDFDDDVPLLGSVQAGGGGGGSKKSKKRGGR